MRFFAFLLVSVSLWGQGVEYVKGNYTKFEYLVPVRDGVKLFTSVYVPKEALNGASTTKYPIMMQRTPYSVAPYGVDKYRASLGPSEKFGKDGFIFVYQDVRGRYQSEGKWLEMTPHKPNKASAKDVDESSDTYDTIDWLVKNIPNNNGRVGMWGISYPGFYVTAGMIDAHPALKAASPQAPVTDLYGGDDSYHNGGLMLAANFGFYLFFKPHLEPTMPENFGRMNPFKSPDGYDVLLRAGTLANATEKYYKEANPYWLATMNNPNLNDFWKSRNIATHLKSIKPAVLTVGGWFDAEDLQGPLRVYRQIQANTPPASGNHLVMGPWTHGGFSRGDGDKVGDINFGSKTSAYYRDSIEFPFFAYHLKSKGDGKFPTAWAFETGTNQWRTFDTWPPKAAQQKKLYFHAGGKLSFDPPAETEGYDEYLADPNKPVPYVSYIHTGHSGFYMTSDQRHASTRPDVLVYESNILDEDVTISGPLTPELFVSSTGTDADFVVKLVDVYPGDLEDGPNNVKLGGYQQLVRGEPFRAKFRNSFEKPEPLTPGKRERVAFALPDVQHTFRKGHRIMVHIQSSWFPLVDRNPQKFINIPDAKASDFQKATHRVYRGKAGGSSIGVGVLN
ncbi:MAG: CocE/NonD family hydrolase [Acidobacteria bacterium]|nr:CocE/NonD family hydrolase [Acidobacteriota bacterium]